MAAAELVDDVPIVELDDVRREAPSFPGRPEAGVELERKEDEEMVRGAGEAIEDTDDAADWERPMTGGGVGVDGNDGVPGLEAGLSQDEKKSSSSACVGGVGEASRPSTKIRCGYLRGVLVIKV